MIRHLPIDKIEPDPNQPRKVFKQAKIDELAGQIEASGLIQPITVRAAAKGRYVIVAGERRWRAHCLLRDRGNKRFAVIACNVESSKAELVEIRAKQIIENMAREDLEPLEEARAFAQYAKDFNLTPEQVAERLGVVPFRVRWRLQLLNLAPPIARMVESGHLDRQQALEVARLERHEDQTRLVQMINRNELVGWKAVRSAADAILNNVTQSDLFGEGEPVVSAAEVETLRTMERKIAAVAAMVAAGWRDGDCVVANKVSPDRAATMADKLAAIRTAISHMERELRNFTAQAKIALAS